MFWWEMKNIHLFYFSFMFWSVSNWKFSSFCVFYPFDLFHPFFFFGLFLGWLGRVNPNRVSPDWVKPFGLTRPKKKIKEKKNIYIYINNIKTKTKKKTNFFSFFLGFCFFLRKIPLKFQFLLFSRKPQVKNKKDVFYVLYMAKCLKKYKKNHIA